LIYETSDRVYSYLYFTRVLLNKNENKDASLYTYPYALYAWSLYAVKSTRTSFFNYICDFAAHGTCCGKTGDTSRKHWTYYSNFQQNCSLGP